MISMILIDFRMALVPLPGKPATRDIPGGKLPSEGDFLQLLHGEVEDRGGFRGFRGIGDLCCTIRKDRCQCDGGEDVGLEAGGEGVEGGSGGAQERKMHCKARGEPCLMAKMKKGWQEAALPVKSSDFNIMEQFNKFKQNFDKSKKPQQRAKHSKMANKYYKTTVNMAPNTWEEDIRTDSVLTAARRDEKIRLLADYIGPNSTR